MCEVVFLEVIGKKFGEFPIAQIFSVRLSAPGPEMQLVNIHGSVIIQIPSLYPCFVRKMKITFSYQPRGRLRPQLRGKRIGIRLVEHTSIRLINTEFIELPRFCIRRQTAPDPPCVPIHFCTDPIVPIANQLNLFRSGSKDTESKAGVFLVSTEIRVGVKAGSSVKLVQQHGPVLLSYCTSLPPFTMSPLKKAGFSGSCDAGNHVLY